MLILKAKKRKILGKKVKKLRKENKIPAVVYGHGIKSQTIEVEKLPFEKVFQEAGESGLIDLIIDNKPAIKVLIHDVQFDPLTGKISHLDFFQIREQEKVTVEVELRLTGESLAVKEKGGILIHHLPKIKIECLPKDLIYEIEVDVSSLRDFNDLIRVKDIQSLPGITYLHGSEEVVVSISAPKVEEEVKVEEKPTEKKPEAEKVEEKPAEEKT